MKIIKYLFFLLLILFIGGALYFATKDGSFLIEETEMIEAPVPVVFDKVNDLTTWENWGPYSENDSTTTFNYPAKKTGEGARFNWKGQDDQGSIETTKVVANKTILQHFTYDGPTGEREALMLWQFEPTSSGTQVNWQVEGEHSLADKAYLSIFNQDFNTTIKNRLQQGINGLHESIRSELETYSIDVGGVTQYGGGYYMYATTATSLDGIDQKLNQLKPQVSRYMEENNITKAGQPMIIYNSYDPTNGSAIISAAIPTTTRVIVSPDSDVLCGFMPAQTVVKTTLKGDYKNLSEALSTTQRYVEENEYDRPDDGAPFAIFANNPDEVPNPADWLTEVYIPINSQEGSTNASGRLD